MCVCACAPSVFVSVHILSAQVFQCVVPVWMWMPLCQKALLTCLDSETLSLCNDSTWSAPDCLRP